MFNKKKSYSLTELTLSAKSVESIQDCVTDNNSICPGERKPPVKNQPFQGFLYVLFTSVFITLTSVFVKKLTYISPGQLSLIRNVGVLSGCLPLAIYNTKEVIGAKKDRLLLLFRGFLGGTALYLNLTTFRYLPLAEAAIVMSTAPAVASLLAFLYLKESFGLMQGISLVFTISGVLLSVRLPELLNDGHSTARFDSTYLAGLASGVGCVVFMSMAVICLRKMKHLHFSVHLLYFGFVGMVENASINAVTSTYEHATCGWDQVFVMLIGVFGFMGHCTLTLAVQKENVGVVSILKASLDIIVAMVFQILFFDERLNIYNISGACLVIMSVSMQGIRNWLRMLPEESKLRKRLKLFLV